MENPSARKASRMDEIEAMLLAHPEGMLPSEIARRLGVNRSTVGRYLPDLPKHIYIDDDGRWKIDRGAYLVDVRFNLHEALSVHLAARLLATRMDRQNPHAAAALRKLGVALERLAPHISAHLGKSADAMDDDSSWNDPGYLQVLETLSIAWAEGRKVKVWHRQEADSKVLTYTFSPYFIEPYAVGQSTHVIGLREPPGKLRTFKIERIERAELTRETYTIPAAFDAQARLANAWGIWYTDEEPIEVKLKFKRTVSGRVKESRWHRSQEITEQPDGSLIWQAQIAEPRELLPWIRSWGADVEVLEPPRLRIALQEETRRLLELYFSEDLDNLSISRKSMTASQTQVVPDWMLFVGKWKDTIVSHPLVYHMLDSAAVAQLLWQEGLTQGAREQFAQWLKIPVDDCGHLMAFWTSLHDLGKATPSFQRKYVPSRTALESRKFNFADLPQSDIVHHSLLSQWILESFQNDLKLPGTLLWLLRLTIGGHHGKFHFVDDQQNSLARTQNLGGAEWNTARLNLFSALHTLLDPPSVPVIRLKQTEQNVFFQLLTGFLVVSDWLSSQDDFFQYESPDYELASYWKEIALLRARHALNQTGWIGWKPDGRTPEFTELFPFSPHPLQQAIIQSAEQLHEPFMMIIEAPTGSGKTEAALIAADRIIQAGNLRGCYIAMPTQATSDQMFTRTKIFLKRRYQDQAVINLQLAHGNAMLNEDYKELRLSAVDVDQAPSIEESSVVAMGWFMQSKRALLAPFGVGTVDQAFISVLRARYSVLRLFGLYRKVVIFDEVHAYDTYMMEIFTRLLAWLRAIGSSVILLSATLPQKTREDLLRAFQPDASMAAIDVPFPRMSINDGQTIQIRSLGEFKDRDILMERVPYDPHDQIDDKEGIGGWLQLLRDQLVDGGCAAIICNTVDRAQEIYHQIREADFVPDDDLFILHARMPFCWRSQREEVIKDRFGKLTAPAKGPRRGIVVATQIIEQSLDLDFDIMISDLAPVDLLIQRIGRLHRHSSSMYPPVRPEKLAQPLCYICQPKMEAESILPVFGNDKYVYAEAILLRTFFTLHPLRVLSLPSNSDNLINRVYSSEPLNECSEQQNREIEQKFKKMFRDQESDIVKARNHLIGDVDYSNSFSQTMYLDDDRGIEKATQAMTRNIILPSVQLVCMKRRNGQTCLVNGDIPYDPNTTPRRDILAHILQSIVSVSKAAIVKHFWAMSSNEAWRNQATIRQAYPVVFENGIYELGNGTRLILDEKRGIVIAGSE